LVAKQYFGMSAQKDKKRDKRKKKASPALFFPSLLSCVCGLLKSKKEKVSEFSLFFVLEKGKTERNLSPPRKVGITVTNTKKKEQNTPSCSSKERCLQISASIFLLLLIKTHCCVIYRGKGQAKEKSFSLTLFRVFLERGKKKKEGRRGTKLLSHTREIVLFGGGCVGQLQKQKKVERKKEKKKETLSMW